MANLFVVALEHSDGSIQFAGKDSWCRTDTPEAVFSEPSAMGKARWWKKVAKNEHNGVTLTSISVKPAIVEVSATVTTSFSCVES